ncbi:holo-ACP synthase [Isachenkonia alkalipeptolytica]|uniref:Holo-[acyl-carrier-protein] synthase n=1 Tax=Isachenkonia alkalipeptolytica TaxID=2565777 RepID=A0AA43XJG1_9CLOT|nr:holo-ACP synthase [Isachenkonia alkalipeptolytica]NBG87020.1 holo-ACP synthase [Isachenkonia alkalipeptolytica]
MVRGIGIDIIEIHRIERAIKKNPKFIHRILTEQEVDYITENQKSTITVAGYFAAKEAVSKALGTGLRGFSWKDVEIHKDSNHRPFAVLHNGAKEQLEIMGATEIWLSISHSKKDAVAQAIISKGGSYD